MPDDSSARSESSGELLSELSDEELVDRFLACSNSGRDRAHACFEELIARYMGLINHVVRSSRFRYPAWDSADDVVSRVVFKVYRGLGQWRRQGKLSSFIARIASSEMIDAIRRTGRDKSWDPRPAGTAEEDETSEIDQAVSPEPSPEAQAVAGEQRLLVSRLLADVCRDWKDSVIVNEYIIGSSDARLIAEKYSISEDLVYQRARRLRVRLLKWLEARGITSADQLLGGTRSQSQA